MDAHWINSGISGQGFLWNSNGEDTPYHQSATLTEAILDYENFKNIWWLESALAAAKKVCRIKFPNGSATGFVVGPDHLITNNHVFSKEVDAENAILQFDYRLRIDGSIHPIDEWQCHPEQLFLTNPELDYTLVSVMPTNNGKKIGEARGYFNLSQNHPIIGKNHRVNIIQHPQGRFQHIAFRDNQVQHVNTQVIQYLTDTDYGSSGSPVFDDYFNVIALHSQRVPNPQSNRWYRNQGYLISSIYTDIKNKDIDMYR
ncbi:MAG: trypsin-like serine peptidase [Salinispira sp.]